MSCAFCFCFLKEVYISKVKAVLGKELHLENGSHSDDAEKNGKTNGFSNGSHKDEHDEDVTMSVQEEESVKSPTSSKGKGGRRSKANSDTKSTFKSLKMEITCTFSGFLQLFKQR